MGSSDGAAARSLPGAERLRSLDAAKLAYVVLGVLLAIVVVRVQHTYAIGGRASWSTVTRAGTAECIKDMGIVDALRGEPCPFVGAPAGRHLVLGAGETLSIAVLSTVTGMDTFQAAVPVGIALSLLGFAGGVALFRALGSSWGPALVGSAVFATTPIMLGIQMFPGTGSGFLSLPAYLAVDALLLRRLARSDGPDARVGRRPLVVAGVLAYVLLRVWAIYLDGYTFVMSGIFPAFALAAVVLVQRPPWRRVAAYTGLFAVANGLAMLIYRRATPGVGLVERNFDLFRGWGADVATLVKPTNDLWWAAQRDLPAARDDLWGPYASSAWNYFGYVLLLLAIAGAVVAIRRRDPLGIGTALVGALALVLCLGPALKVNAIVPPDMLANATQGKLMPRGQSGALELPWADLWRLPGFSSMRHPYRWVVLARLAAIALATLAVTRLLDRRRWFAGVAVGLLALMVVEAAPNMDKWTDVHERADQVQSGVRDEAIPALRRVTTPGMRVVFVDGTGVANEYIVTPLATYADLTTYNIGGDKHLFRVRASWPAPVRNLITVPNGVVAMEDVRDVLAEHADAVIFLDFDLVRSIDRWPVSSKEEAFAEVLVEARRAPDLQVTDGDLMTVVSLRR